MVTLIKCNKCGKESPRDSRWAVVISGYLGNDKNRKYANYSFDYCSDCKTHVLKELLYTAESTESST